MDRKVERREGFLRRRKAKQNSKSKRLNRLKKDALKYKEGLNMKEVHNED
jgi:hypothetical protein|tara:strand:+ start:328 stop:477 length:150 start_codon:yes stop_codon:yes gene_type:complete